jgi:methyl-accepting chemotaxis protein
MNATLDAVIAPVMDGIAVLEQLAHCDLTARISADYQGDHARMKESVNATALELQRVMGSVQLAIAQVSDAAGQIAASSQTLAQGASEQAGSLEETSASLEQMSSMIKQNADSSQQAQTLARSAADSAGDGISAVERMSRAMAEIHAAAAGTSAIIKDINEIAFQTNLLALNAAVEAARAGEAGRGFAVVAEEVRSLACRAKEAAKNTEELIAQSVTQAESGQGLAADVSSRLRQISGDVTKVHAIISEIALASREQATGIEQVNRAVAEMDSAVQVTAANAEENSSVAEELSGQVQEVKAQIDRFRVDVAGSRGPGQRLRRLRAAG